MDREVLHIVLAMWIIFVFPASFQVLKSDSGTSQKMAATLHQYLRLMKSYCNLLCFGRPTIFIEIIQRVGCMLKDDAGQMYQKGGCGGFGKGNFSELFKSIEEYEKTLEAKQITGSAAAWEFSWPKLPQVLLP